MKQILLAPFNAIYRMFLWASGANLDVLDQAPTDKNKYFGIGGTIVFTALMASFAGGYAFFTAFKSELFAVFFGLFWGALIFNLDRYIVSTFGVGDGKKTISRQELLEAAPRLVMACLLGFIIAIPLELKIFDKEIEVEIKKLKIAEKTKIILADSTITNALNVDKIELDDLNGELRKLQNDKVQLVRNEKLQYSDDLSEKNSDLVRIENELVVQQKRVNRAYENYNFSRNDETDRFSTAQIAKYSSVYSSSVASRNRLRNERDELKQEISQIRDSGSTASEAKGIQIENDIANLRTRIDIITTRVTNAEANQDSTVIVANDVGSVYDGFGAHLEAMNNLTNEKPAIWWAKWLITLLFIFIEIAPILFKMMTERGPYDDIMDRIKHEVKVKQLLAQSNLNQWVNNAVQQNQEKNGQLLAQELASNEELMKQVAQAQAEIAAVAIEAWKKEQIEKMRNNPGQTVTSSSGLT